MLPMSRQVAAAVLQRGRATTDDIQAAFPHIPRQSLAKALNNAKWMGLIQHERKGTGKRNSPGVPAIWCAPIPGTIARPERQQKTKESPAASVWELGTKPQRPWPPSFTSGRAYQLLGDWNAE